MRKNIFIFFILLLAFAMMTTTGCGKMPTDPSSTNTDNTNNNTGGDNNNGGGDYDNNTGNDEIILPPVASFYKDGYTYFVTWFMTKGESNPPSEPWYLDPVPEWVLANYGKQELISRGQVFEYAGVITLANGSTWDCHRIKGKFPSFQVVSSEGHYANPGLAGNWIADGVVDPNQPAKIPGVFVDPPTYYFTPVEWGSW